MLAQPVACTCTARCRTMPIEGKRRASCLLFQTDLGAASCEMQDTSSCCSFCLNQRQPKTAQPEKTRNSNMGKIFPLHKSHTQLVFDVQGPLWTRTDWAKGSVEICRATASSPLAFLLAFSRSSVCQLLHCDIKLLSAELFRTASQLAS